MTGAPTTIDPEGEMCRIAGRAIEIETGYDADHCRYGLALPALNALREAGHLRTLGTVEVSRDDTMILVEEAEPRGMRTNGNKEQRLRLAIQRIRAALDTGAPS